MVVPINTQVEEIMGEAQLIKFSLSDIKSFPLNEFLERRIIYQNLFSWYNGDKLKETQIQGGKQVEKFPIKLNPIRGAVYKHAYALFGEFSMDSRPLAPAQLRPDDMSKKDQAQRGQDFLNTVWAESHGRSVQMRNGLISQINGGCVFKTSYVPKARFRTYPFRVEGIHVSNFIGVPMSGEEFRLEEAWIVKAISHDEAKRKFGLSFDPAEPVYYVEYWNPDECDFSVNGVRITSGIRDTLGKEILYGGKNPWGFVPITYIPRVRTNGFYGESLITDNVQGIVEELNRRTADFGDAVSDDSHTYYVLVGASKRPDIYELAPGVRVIQIKPEPSFTGKEVPPSLERLGAQKANESMDKLIDQLYNNFRREAFVPAVADGEDEGSQRSALTLAMRMWPLLSHTSMQRILWGDGLSQVDNQLLRMAQIKGFGDIPQSVTRMRIERKWAPFLPRDSESFINELVNRASANLGSTEHLLSLIDDIEDPAEQYKMIIAQLKEIADIDAKATAEAQAAAYQARADATAQNQTSTPQKQTSKTTSKANNKE